MYAKIHKTNKDLFVILYDSNRNRLMCEIHSLKKIEKEKPRAVKLIQEAYNTYCRKHKHKHDPHADKLAGVYEFYPQAETDVLIQDSWELWEPS